MTTYAKTETNDRTLHLRGSQAKMVGEFIASTYKQLQVTANKHRVYHPTISQAAHEYMNETYDLLRQLEMDHLIMPRHMRPIEDE